MHPALRISLIGALSLAAIFLGVRFGRSYAVLGEKSAQRYSSSDLTSVRVPEIGKPAEPAKSGETNPSAAIPRTNLLSQSTTNAPPIGSATNLVSGDSGTSATSAARSAEYSKAYARAMGYGGALFLVAIVLAVFVAHEVTQAIARRAGHVLFDDSSSTAPDPEYDHAEQEWARGNHLGAIGLLREYLQRNPREIHAAIRIAEIYEKDLKNPLAAALEYEEILQKKFHPERWGWAAIHLANIYSGKLGKPDKALALLQRIEAECPKTGAAEKARQRLAAYQAAAAEGSDTAGIGTMELSDDGAARGESPPQPPPRSSVPPAVSPFPPGFRPKKG
jgi:tetratricopeptide (TPR) repeat protein